MESKLEEPWEVDPPEPEDMDLLEQRIIKYLEYEEQWYDMRLRNLLLLRHWYRLRESRADRTTFELLRRVDMQTNGVHWNRLE